LIQNIKKHFLNTFDSEEKNYYKDGSTHWNMKIDVSIQTINIPHQGENDFHLSNENTFLKFKLHLKHNLVDNCMMNFSSQKTYKSNIDKTQINCDAYTKTFEWNFVADVIPFNPSKYILVDGQVNRNESNEDVSLTRQLKTPLTPCDCAQDGVEGCQIKWQTWKYPLMSTDNGALPCMANEDCLTWLREEISLKILDPVCSLKYHPVQITDQESECLIQKQKNGIDQ